MSLVVGTESLPLSMDVDGAVRIAKTRVTLDTIVAAFHDGLTAEEISQQYPAVDLGEIYTVIGYYLRHRQEVDEYLAMKQRQADRIQQETEERFDPVGVRSRLLARRGSQE